MAQFNKHELSMKRAMIGLSNLRQKLETCRLYESSANTWNVDSVMETENTN